VPKIGKYKAGILIDGADASRRTIGLRIIIRFRSCASRLTIKRMQQIAAHASKLASPPSADPQPVGSGEMTEQIQTELEATASRAVHIATSLLCVTPELAGSVSAEQIPRDAGTYIWRFGNESSPAYVGVGLGRNGLFQRITTQHLRSSYLKSVFRKAIVADFGVDPSNGAVNCIKVHFSLAYLPCPEDTFSVIGIAESMLISTLKPKYNKAKK